MRALPLLITVGIAAVLTSLPSVAFARRDEFDAEILAASERHGIPFYVIKGIIAVESGFNPNARNPNSSATGLMQVTRAAATDTFTPYEQLTDPAINIDAGTAYLAKMREFTGNIFDAIVAYHDGPGNWQRGVDVGGRSYRMKVASYIAALAIGGF